MKTSQLQIQGSIVALVTPMHADGSLDWSSLKKLIEFHIEQGTNAVVAVGTTGESATLSVSEHIAFVEKVVDYVNGRIPVIAGTGANSTSEAVELTRYAADGGADACLLVVPYYNKPTQEGLYRHFMHIADAVAIPQILYNVPGRTITDMGNAVTLRLASHQNIIGIKDATGDMDRGQELIDQAPEGFSVFSGDDPTAYDLILRGGKGNISVTANVVPALMSELCRLSLAGEAESAQALQKKLSGLHSSLFIESNPIPVKAALNQMGLIPEGIRLPLTPLSEANLRKLEQVLRTYSLSGTD